MSKTFYIAAAVVVIILLGGLVVTFMRATPVASNPSASPEPIPNPEPTPAAPPPAPPPAAANQAVITYTDSGFSPNTLTVKAGTTATFKNQSSEPFWPASNVHPSHMAYDGTSMAEHCQNPTSNAFDACVGVQPGASWTFTFNKIGTWSYHDHLNPGMRGSITVQ